MKWFALAFAAAWLLSKFYERASFALAVWINHLFRHDGKDATVPPTTSAPDVTESMRAGSPFAVDASNGPLPDFPFTPLAQGDTGCPPILLLGMRNEPVFLDPTTDSERMKLSGLVEVHKLPEGIVPPPSRSIRRSIH